MAREADSACEELRKMLESQPEAADRAAELAEKIGALRTRELVRLVRSIAKVRSTLTPAQRAVLATEGF